MDPRNTTTNNPFTRPPSQPNGHDAHRAPIPPPPYTLQAPVQRQPRLGHDPFLPRRQEQGDARQDMDKSFRHAPLGVVKYGASLPKDALGNTTEDYRAQDNGGGWRFGDGRMDRFRHQASSGESYGFSLHNMQSSVSDRCAIFYLAHRVRNPTASPTAPIILPSVYALHALPYFLLQGRNCLHHYERNYFCCCQHVPFLLLCSDWNWIVSTPIVPELPCFFFSSTLHRAASYSHAHVLRQTSFFAFSICSAIIPRSLCGL